MRFGPTSTPFLAGIARRHDSEGRVGLDVRFGSKADICSALGDVRFMPIADMVGTSSVKHVIVRKTLLLNVVKGQPRSKHDGGDN